MITVGSAAELPPEIWAEQDRPGALFNSAEWFRLAEASGSSLTYLTASGPSPAMLPAHSGGVRTGGAYDHETAVLRPAMNGRADRRTPCLTVGSWNSTMSTGPVGTAPDLGQTTQLVEDALAFAISRGDTSISWPFLTRDAASTLSRDFPDRAVVLRCTPSTVMDVGFPTFSDYLASMPTRKRWNFLREERRFSDALLKLDIERLADVRHDVVGLIAHGQSKRNPTASRDRTAALVEAQIEIFGDKALAFTARRGTALVAVTTAVAALGGLYIRSYGASEELTGGDGTYFVLTYAAPQRYAFDHGLSWIHAGIGAYEAKARRGFRLVPLWTAFIGQEAVTLGERAAAQKWNDAEEARWSDWYANKLNLDLPDDWRWPDELR